MASDFRQLAEILNQERLVTDIGPLRAAENDCLKGTSATWHYSVERLLFKNLGKGLKIIPRHVEEHDLVLEFSFQAEEWSSIPLGASPFTKYEFNVHMYAEYCDPITSEILKASCAWHLDFHLEKKEEKLPAFVHPSYHFQHGGRLVEEHKETIGPILVIDSPRLAHPPMDAVLGIDFVLTNFFESARLTTLRSNSVYRSVLKRSQERLWKPYFHSLASVWPGEYQEHWQPSRLLPQLIV
jgi:hypothetical protein